MSIQAINNISFTAKKDKAQKAPKEPKAPTTPGIGGKSKGYESLLVPGLGQFTDKRKSAAAKFFTAETLLAAGTGVAVYLNKKAESAWNSISDELSNIPEACDEEGNILAEAFDKRAAELKVGKLIDHAPHFLYGGLAAGGILLATHLANIIDAAGGKNKKAMAEKIVEANEPSKAGAPAEAPKTADKK